MTTRTAFAEALSVALRASDLDYVGARGVDDAVGSLNEDGVPAAVVVDLMSIDGDGASLCDAVRAKDEGAQVPVIFCGNGNQDIKSTTDALIVGGDGYFQLPIEAAKVVAKIATYVGCLVPDLPASLTLNADDEAQPPSDLLDRTAAIEAVQPRPISMDDEKTGTNERPDMADITDAMAARMVAEAIDTTRGRTLTDQPPSHDTPAESENLPVTADVHDHDHDGDDGDSDGDDGDDDDDHGSDERAAAIASALAGANAEIEAQREALAQREAELAAQREAQREAQRRSEEEAAAAEARLQELELRREQAELEAQRETEAAAARAAEEQARIAELERKRAEAEERARAAAEAAAARQLEEEARLQELERKRVDAEEKARAAFEEAAQREAAERARLDELERMRVDAEEKARAAFAEVAHKEATENARLAELEKRRAEAEERARVAFEEAAQRQASESARLAELERRRVEAEERAQAAVAEAQQRELEETARLELLEKKRRDAEEAARRASAEAQKREIEEQARLEELEKRRRDAEQLARAALEENAQRELDEKLRLEELARRRRAAEEETTRTLAEIEERERVAREALEDAARRAAEERARLEDLERMRHEAEDEALRTLGENEARERLLRESLAETERREVEERKKLDEIAQLRAEAEAENARAVAEAARREDEAKKKLAEIERERDRAVSESERAAAEARAAQERERERLSVLERERIRVEDEAKKERDRAAALEREERERLREVAAEREALERELEAAIGERQKALAVEEERLHALRRARSEAESEAVRAAADREEREREAEEKLAEARRLRAQVEAEAAAEMERLARVRAEDDLARRELEEKRTRARLSFQTGRLDSVPTGLPTAAVDVGALRRSSADDEGVVAGGGLLPFVPVDAEPAPPPAFVALEPAQGRFVEGELPGLLWACKNLKVTGVVDVGLDDGRTRSVFFEEGEPVLVLSALTVDRAEEGLLRAGFITSSRYNEMRVGPLRSARRAAAALVAEGELKTEELFPAVRGVLTEQVLSLLEHDAGTFNFREEYAHAADRVRLEHTLDALLAEGIRRKYDEKRLWFVLGGPSSIIAPDVGGAEVALPPLSPEEKVALARLDGTRALEDVILETGIAVVVVLRTALIALSCGAARMLARGMPADPAERAAQRERSVAIDRARILDKLHAARQGDYFTFLGIEMHASPFEVQRAAERLRARFDPARFGDPAFADVRAALKEITEVTFDAEHVLGDEALADGYRKNLLGQIAVRARRRA